MEESEKNIWKKTLYLPDIRLLIDNVAKASPPTRTTPAIAAPNTPESKLHKLY